MDMSPFLIMLSLGLIAAVVTAIRSYGDAKLAKKERESAETAAEYKRYAAQTQLDAMDFHASASVESECACAYLDKDAQKIVVFEDSVHSDVYLLADLDSIELIDNSTEYKNAQEMHSYYHGIKRDSLYEPYGSHKMREVKEGEKLFNDMNGELIYGIKITLKDQSSKSYAFYRGGDSAVWDRESELIDVRHFVYSCRSSLS